MHAIPIVVRDSSDFSPNLVFLPGSACVSVPPRLTAARGWRASSTSFVLPLEAFARHWRRRGTALLPTRRHARARFACSPAVASRPGCCAPGDDFATAAWWTRDGYG